MATQPVPFHAKWDAVPLAFIDFETTGIVPGVDQAVEVGIARFEGGQFKAGCGSRLNPGCPIPGAATKIHGITDADVADKPTVADYLTTALPKALLGGAQPAAYNAPYDRWFMPPAALAEWTWPWLDTLVLVAEVDRFAKGPGRHRLEPSCARHGVKLDKAHSADADARAAGELFHVLLPKVFGDRQPSMGRLLFWTRQQEARRWADFHDWLGRQPAK